MYKYSKDEIEKLAYGHWPDILISVAGLTKKQTENRGQPCPMCGGKDRYNFSDYARAGNYFCRGCGAGNGWTMLKKLRGYDFTEALEKVAEYLAVKPMEVKTKVIEEGAPEIVVPVPSKIAFDPNVPVTGMTQKGKPFAEKFTMLIEWYNEEGQHIGYVARPENKETKQIFYDKKQGWTQGSLGDNRPLLGLETLCSTGRVIVVEGEKTWKAVHEAMPYAQVVTWTNGATSVKKSNWAVLDGRELLLCPDNDDPGRKAMKEIEKMCRNSIISYCEAPEGSPAHWDLADYEGNDLQSFIEEYTISQKQLQEIEEEHEETGKQTLLKFLKPLGFDKKRLFFLPGSKMQLIEANSADMGKGVLRSLAPTSLWRSVFPNNKADDCDWDLAADWVIRACEKKGVFDYSKSRGNGAWWDNNRQDIVVHLGNRLLVNNVPMKLNEYESKYYYPNTPRVISFPELVLSSEEKKLLVDIAKGVEWEYKAAANITLSFILLSPICGLLNWRFNVWYKGPAGSGKSTFLEQFLYRCLEGLAIKPEGTSTEAAIRQTIGDNSLPVVFDEPEGDTEYSKKIIDMLIRFIRLNSSSSGGLLLKGSPTGEAQQYQLQSMFALSSINSIKLPKQDRDRIIELEIRPTENRRVNWKKLQKMMSQLPVNIPGKVMSYSITNAPRILKQVDAFKEYFAEKTGSERYGDQYGTAMAGEWILMNEHIPTREEIEKALEIDSGIWDIIEDRDATTSQGDFLLFLSQLIIPILDTDGRRYERTFLEIIKVVSGRDPENGLGFDKACLRSLNHRGITYDNGQIIFSKNNENLMKLFNTNPQYQDYITLLKRIKGSEEKRKQIGGERLSCVIVPEKAILDLDWMNKEWENKQKLMEF